VHNDAINSRWGKFKTLLGLAFSVPVYFKLRRRIRIFQPDVVHIHNYFPQLSPAVFYACKSMGVPCVHTLHNFRAICPSAFLMHKGKVTERSIHQGPWWTIRHKVYKDSLVGTLALCFMIAGHRKLNTWKNKVDAFICLTEFSKAVYLKAGWPSSKLFIKPNFLSAPEAVPAPAITGNYAVFVGRLCREKGIDLLLKAWERIDFPLYIIGDGLDRHLVEDSKLQQIHYIGQQPKGDVLSYIKGSSFLVMASTWYEGLPMVLIEAFACGTCAIVPNIGGMAEVVKDNVTGLHFEAGNPDALSSCVNSAVKAPTLLSKLSQQASKVYQNEYSEEINHQLLTKIYTKVLAKQTY